MTDDATSVGPSTHIGDDALVEIRRALEERGSPDTDGIGDEDDLFQACLSSLDAVRVILALEMQFDVAVPDSMLTRKHIRTIRSLRQLLETISG